MNKPKLYIYTDDVNEDYSGQCCIRIAFYGGQDDMQIISAFIAASLALHGYIISDTPPLMEEEKKPGKS